MGRDNCWDGEEKASGNREGAEGEALLFSPERGHGITTNELRGNFLVAMIGKVGCVKEGARPGQEGRP